jgi:hypothetical protein
MPITIENYIDVKERALELECNIPDELSILPRNFEIAKSKSELVYESSVPDIRILFREAGIIETRLEKQGDKCFYKQDKHFDWIGPTIFISASFLSQNPHIISITEGIISNYLTDLFKGKFYSEKIELTYVLERTKDKEIKRIVYKGDLAGLDELPKIIRERLDNER